MTNHANLTPERWSRFTRTQQLLQIAAEMHRATSFVASSRSEHVREGYERVLRLVDLTAQTQRGRSFLRELLRWRTFVAGLYIAPELDLDAHRMALRVLLELDSEAAGQIEYLLA
ncbi:MAG: hypothetical protein HZA53_15515 [Planctomycetes bacterium]|nr:hypothetical protein [Planctomycetota bacterium]